MKAINKPTLQNLICDRIHLELELDDYKDAMGDAETLQEAYKLICQAFGIDRVLQRTIKRIEAIQAEVNELDLIYGVVL